MNWRDEQRQLWEWIRQPSPPQPGQNGLQTLFSAPAGLSRQAALGIYHNAYHQRLLHIAGELYPGLQRTLDSETFEALWLDYFQQFPPEPGPVSTLGRHLPGFLSDHPVYRDLPALLDIARLENHFIALFEQPDEPVYRRAQLETLPPDQWSATRWQVRQDWTLMQSRFDLQGYWERLREHFADPAAEPGSAPFGVPALDAPGWLLIHRQGGSMQLRRVTGPMAVFLEGLRAGLDFADLCRELASHYPDRDIAALGLALLLQTIDWELLSRQL